MSGWLGYSPNKHLSKTTPVPELFPMILLQLEKAEKAIMRFGWERYNYKRRLHQSYQKNALLSGKDFIETDYIFPKKNFSEFCFIPTLPYFKSEIDLQRKARRVKKKQYRNRVILKELVSKEKSEITSAKLMFVFEDEKNIDYRYD